MSDYRDENIWLMEGDCLERMKEIPDGSVDMVLVIYRRTVYLAALGVIGRKTMVLLQILWINAKR